MVICLCMWVCLAWYRGRGALSEASPDNHRHLRGSVGGGHRVRCGLLQNQVSTQQSTLRLLCLKLNWVQRPSYCSCAQHYGVCDVVNVTLGQCPKE